MTTKHQSHRRAAMIPAETVSRLRRLADDWRKEEKQLCEQLGNEIIPHSMRARRIKDTKALDAAIEMIEQKGKTEQALKLMTKGYKSIPYARWPAEMHFANEVLEKLK